MSFCFSLWQRLTAMYVISVDRHGRLYENEVSKYPQQSPPRWVIGTGQLSRLWFRAGPIARRGGGRHDIIFRGWF